MQCQVMVSVCQLVRGSGDVPVYSAPMLDWCPTVAAYPLNLLLRPELLSLLTPLHS